jgi:flagellar motor switch protein FliN/FliY
VEQFKAKKSRLLYEFNELEQDTVKEIGNISLGASATILSQLIGNRVLITTPEFSHKTAEEINNSFTVPCVLVEVEYIKGLKGKNMLIIDPRDAVIIGQLMMMEEPDPESEITEIYLSAVSEAMNQMMGTAATAMSDVFQRVINISSPTVKYMPLNEALEEERIRGVEGGFVQVAFRIEVEGLIDSRLMQIMPVEFARNAVNFLLGKYLETEPGADLEKVPAGHDLELPPPVEAMADNLSAVTGSLTKGDSSGAEVLFLENILLEVKGIVGKTRIPLKKVLELGVGSVCELNTRVGDNVEVLVNGKKVAYADIVAVGNQYGLKIKKILKN